MSEIIGEISKVIIILRKLMEYIEKNSNASIETTP